MTSRKQSEGLRFARLMMVLSSLSPLFTLWAVHGFEKIPDKWVCSACAILVIVPNLFLYVRIQVCRRQNDKKVLTIGSAEDHREYLLVYLFATLIPFFDTKLDSNREIAATLVALFFIVYIFFHLNLHYMNILFALFGYRVFTIEPPEGGVGGHSTFVLLTQRSHLAANSKVNAYRISDNVFFEPKE